MKRSFQQRPTTQRSRNSWPHRGLPVLVVLCVLFQVMPATTSAAPLRQESTLTWSAAQTTHFEINVEGGGGAAAATFAVAHGGQIETAFRELTLLFPVSPPAERVPINVYTNETSFESARLSNNRPEIPGVSVFMNPSAGSIDIFMSSFTKLSAVEAENQLRHAIAHLVTDLASAGNIPWGFDEGIAQYIERPVNEKLARTASIVQTAHTRGELPSWFDMNRPNAFVEPSLAAAQSYSVIAFLIDRYGISKLRQFLIELRTTDTWSEAMRLAYSGDQNDIEKQWGENVPEWTSGAWRENLVAAFDLEPAKRYLEQANYAAAKEALTPSETLFEQIGDREQLAYVQGLIAQCDIGIQAESLMVQTQKALESHTYDRAMNLLTQAKLQFAQLPPEQQPNELISHYELLATQGIEAKEQLNSAVLLSHSWRDYAEARDAARNAGVTFAALGDETNVALAQAELDRLDQRQRRVVLLLVALGVLTLVWLGLWLWARGPSELDWR